MIRPSIFAGNRWKAIAGVGILGIAFFLYVKPIRSQTTQPGRIKEVAARMDADTAKLHDLMGTQGPVVDPVKRRQIAPDAIKVLYRISTDLDDWAKVQPEQQEEVAATQTHFLMLRAFFGDKPAIDLLQQLADSKDSQKAFDGKRAQLTLRWYNAYKDEAAQNKIADELESAAKAHSESDELTDELLMLSDAGPATPALSNRLTDLVINVMKGPEATNARTQILQVRKLKGMENKQLVISGNLVNGKSFTSADWKGKVILVDFWATWCGPCLREMPRVVKAYGDYHGKGLEVIGVSNDYAATDLTQFLAGKKEMPWPQLFDATAASQQTWNSITLGYGINSIPTMFLIDKKGILRSADAGQDFESQIPALLAE